MRISEARSVAPLHFSPQHMQIYKAPDVSAIQAFYGELLVDRTRYSIGEHLTLLAARLWEGLQTQHQAAFSEISNYHPMYLGSSLEALRLVDWAEADAHQTITAVYGVQDWQALSSTAYDTAFEAALDAMLAGDEAMLRQLLAETPHLSSQRSPYGHRATLLHYASANGVEMWRQQVPHNLPTIVAILLEAGAAPSATMQVYGGAYNTRHLLETSAHPLAAGVVESVLALLQ